MMRCLKNQSQSQVNSKLEQIRPQKWGAELDPQGSFLLDRYYTYFLIKTSQNRF